MPRTAIPIEEAPLGGSVTATGVAIDNANEHVIAAGGDTSHILVFVDNTAVGAGTIIVKAGVNPPAFRKDIGDQTVAIGATSREFFVVESARHVQANGDIYVDADSLTGTIYAFRLPRDL